MYYLGDVFNSSTKKKLSLLERIENLKFLGYEYDPNKKVMYYPIEYTGKLHRDGGYFTAEGILNMTDNYFSFLMDGGNPLYHISMYGGNKFEGIEIPGS